MTAPTPPTGSTLTPTGERTGPLPVPRERGRHRAPRPPRRRWWWRR